MAEGKILLEIVTPERKLVSDEVDEVTAPGFMGEFGVLPRHTPYLCELDIGVLTYRDGSARYFVSVVNGYAEVGSDKVTVLAEKAERAEDISTERARAALRRAQERLSGKHDGAFDFARAEGALRRALTRIEVAHQSGVDQD